MPRARPRVRRENVIAGLWLTAFTASVVLLGAFALVETWFEPDGFFGRPGRIEACGRTYDLSPQRIWTRAEIDAAVNPGLEPSVFEPILGELPLLALLSGPRNLDGLKVCDTVVWLHVGPDAYVAYALEGGP